MAKKKKPFNNAKLRPEDVRAIRRAAEGRPWGVVSRLAAKYRVSIPAISDIINNRTWKGV